MVPYTALAEVQVESPLESLKCPRVYQVFRDRSFPEGLIHLPLAVVPCPSVQWFP